MVQCVKMLVFFQLKHGNLRFEVIPHRYETGQVESDGGTGGSLIGSYHRLFRYFPEIFEAFLE
jgi:hypothetical protein